MHCVIFGEYYSSQSPRHLALVVGLTEIYYEDYTKGTIY